MGSFLVRVYEVMSRRRIGEIDEVILLRRADAYAQACPSCGAEPGRPCVFNYLRVGLKPWRGACSFCLQPGTYSICRQRWPADKSPLETLARNVDRSILGLPRIAYPRSPDHLPSCPRMKSTRAHIQAAIDKGLPYWSKCGGIPDTARYCVSWPYRDCKVFDYGDRVFYREVDGVLEFWHRDRQCWAQSSRPNILEEAHVLRLF